MVSGPVGSLLQLLFLTSRWREEEGGGGALGMMSDDPRRRPFISNGGWLTFPGDLLVQPGPCNIDIRDGTLGQEEFLAKYAYARPVVIRDAADNDLFRALTER